MGFFGSKKQRSNRGESSLNYRQPIVGSRKISWDRAHDSSKTSDGRTVQSGFAPPQGSMTDPTVRRDYSHSRDVSTGEQSSRSLRRRSYQTDTTSRSLEPDARSLRVRASDVFRSKPNLRFKQPVNYSMTPDGHLPTLRGNLNGSAFVDDLADEMDTHQLRAALDTDLRRRKRRQSALAEGRHGSRRIVGSHRQDSSLVTVGGPRPEAHIAPPLARDAAGGVILAGTPVYDRFMEIKRATSTSSATHNQIKRVMSDTCTTHNQITGASSLWRDPEAAEDSAAQRSETNQSGIILAGNRESFPDFAVVDRSNRPARTSTSSGLLTTAWSSLWRRASTARTKKENDVALHRTRTLEQMNASSEKYDRLRGNGSTLADSSRSTRPFSASSSVLYETFDDLPRPSDPVEDHNDLVDPPILSGFTTYANDVPPDAFYDPTSTPRASSRLTHSRNFSRPTNESRLGQYGASLRHNQESANTFSPLLSGDVFPKPEQRPLIGRNPENGVASASGTEIASFTNNNNINGPSSELGFRSPDPAAGLTTVVADAASVPSAANFDTGYNPPVPSRALDYTYKVGLEPPRTQTLGSVRPVLDRANTSQSVHSLQSLDSEGSWLAKRTSDIDDIVRRSFSRNVDGRPSSVSSRVSYLTRPNSTASHLRAVITTERSGSDSETDVLGDLLADHESDPDDHLDSPVDKDLNSDLHGEHGIWHTGIGRMVKVVSSLGDEGRPIVMDRAEIPSVGPTRQHSMDVYTTRLSSESRETIRLEDAPRFVQRDSFMTSTASFHTADIYSSTAASVISSNATLNLSQ